jgi:putative membrane protein
MQGRGYEAVMLTAVGGLGAVAFFGLCSPFFLTLLGPFKQLVAPHSFWFLALMLVFMVMSEWPKGGDRGRPGQRFLDAWSSLFAGQATLLLSGLLGFIILYKPIVPPRFAFQNIMPAFVGLYAVPWIITNIISRMPLPRQVIPKSIDAPQPVLLRATAAGVGGGMIAALFPLITGGMGGLIAGHATAQKDERAFVISQGASKMVYYVGAFFLLFVPGLARTRGGMAWMVQSFYTPSTFQDYWMIVATILICGGASFLMLILLTRGMLWLIQKVDHRLLSAFTAVLVLVVVYAITSWQGILVMIVSTGIGMIPVFFHSRRMNCMGVLLIPVTLNMAGLGPAVADFLGLMS